MTLKILSGRQYFPDSTHHKYYPVVLSTVTSNPSISDLAAQCSNLALNILTAFDWACMKANAFEWLFLLPNSRAAEDGGPSSCGLQGTVAVRRTAAIVTATPIASTRCRSAAVRRMETCPGTARPVRPPSPQPTAVEPSMRNRLWVSFSLRLQIISTSYPLIEEVA